ncbi:MAG: sulfatase [Spirochaetota bacterium]
MQKKILRFYFILLLFSMLAWSCGGASKKSSGMNVIMITADDLGWKDLSCYGCKDVDTPNIDRLAREGVRFTNCFAVSSSCAPSRATLVTGQYPHSHGVDGLAHIRPQKSLSPFSHTLPKVLMKSGYHTGIEGKWHIAPFFPKRWYGYKQSMNPLNPFSMHIESSENAVEFIEAHIDERFYLELNYMNNHRNGDGTFDAVEEYMPNPDEISIPEYYALPDTPELREDLARYHSQTMKMDAMIGDVVETLERLGLRDSTLIIFLSDNGAPYPGNKMTLYDRGTGVPLIISAPSTLPQGEVVDAQINTVDIMPTVLDVLDLETSPTVHEQIQGESFVRLLRHPGRRTAENPVFTEMTYHVEYVPTRAVRSGGWKYIRNYSSSPIGLDQLNHFRWAHELCRAENQPWLQPRTREELYNLKVDPTEQMNLAGAEQAQLERMRALLKLHMHQTEDPYLERSFEDDYDPENYRYEEYQISWWDILNPAEKKVEKGLK